MSSTGKPSVAADIDASIRVGHGKFVLDAIVRVPAGSVLAVLGPNGAGKTTLLRALAGLQRIDRGSIRLAGRVVDNGRQRAPGVPGVFEPPQQRQAGVVFQDYLLFAHLSVLENVAFGPRARGLADARERASAQLARLGIADLADRRPTSLSGGQAQRVALARALAINPQILLLDEPLAALDVQVRDAVRMELVATLRDFPGATVLVTHDPVDAFAIADQVLVLEAGQVTQIGPPHSLVEAPRTAYVAALTGLNLVCDQGLASGQRAVIDPRAVQLTMQAPSAKPESICWSATVTGVLGQVDGVRVSLSGPPDLVAWVPMLQLANIETTVGSQVWVSVARDEIRPVPGPTD
ncbi:MAG: ABC transporter ATP-binding protein [Actinomycetales bacterium]|nr:ABC transporter ATP-binding protein [Actinomycetales bacterium]